MLNNKKINFDNNNWNIDNISIFYKDNKNISVYNMIIQK